MVFAVNPTAEMTYDTFEASAANGRASAAPSDTASGSTAPDATSSIAAATSTLSSTYGSVSSLIFGPLASSFVNDASLTYGNFREFVSSNSNQYLQV